MIKNKVLNVKFTFKIYLKTWRKKKMRKNILASKQIFGSTKY